jgi:alkylation response protein AidB-like acyl-CoA dehydrogenase
MLKGAEFLIPSDQVAGTFTEDDLSEDQRQMRNLAADFMEENVLIPAAIAAIESKDYTVTRRLLSELGGLGFLGIEVPEKFGGLGCDLMTSCVVAEQFAGQGSFATTFSAHTGIGTWPLLYFGTQEQKERYLSKLASGEWIGAYALTEAGSGSDAGAARTTAVPQPKLSGEGVDYALTGEKMFVTNGGIADLFTVFAQVPGAGLTAFLVERATPGVSIGAEEHKLGIRGSSTTPVILDNVRVPGGNMLGVAGKGLKIALNILNLGRFKLGVACLGAARRVMADAVAYAQQRTQFGKPIISFGLVRQHIAGMATRIAAMEAIVYRTAWFLEYALAQVHGDDQEAALKAISEYAMECSIVKVFCSEALWWMTDANVQVHGGYGFIEEYSAERSLRDSRINRIFEGTNEINRLVILDTLGRKAASKNGSKPSLDLKSIVSSARRDSTHTGALLAGMFDEARGLAGYHRVPQTHHQSLNSAKRIALMAIGSVLRRFGSALAEEQITAATASDCIIDLFVLDSLFLATTRMGPTETGDACERLFRADTMPQFTARVRELFEAGLNGTQQARALALVPILLPPVVAQRPVAVDHILNSLAG